MFSKNERSKIVNMENGQNQQYIEEEIFQLAAEAFEKNVPLQNGIETLELHPCLRTNIRADRLIRMVVHGKELRYYAEIKAHVTKAQRLLLQLNRQDLEYPIFLITRHINTETAEELRKNNIEFIDTAGNAFINNPPVYVFIKATDLRK